MQSGNSGFAAWGGLAVTTEGTARKSVVDTKMQSGLSAHLEHHGEWWIGFCPEVPGANGQGTTSEDCLHNLEEAVALILDESPADG